MAAANPFDLLGGDAEEDEDVEALAAAAPKPAAPKPVAAKAEPAAKQGERAWAARSRERGDADARSAGPLRARASF
jgi:hypothetical protein